MTDINFVEVDSHKIVNDLISAFENALGETFYPSDERRVFLQQQAQVIVALYNSLNDTGRQNLLRYARGEILDALGERTDTPRLQAKKATVTLQFTLSSVQGNPVTVPAGTRVTPDGSLYFATSEELIIAAGQTTGTVSAESTGSGELYNGFVAGQINQIVDPIPYVSSVSNTTTSADGTYIEPDDDGVNIWSGYRERIRQSPSKFSTAGPADAYIYWAKTADVDIQDVAVTSPAAGQIKIAVLMKDGLPSQDVLDKVLAVCSDKKVRPLTDNVSAAAPTLQAYNIEFTYYINANKAAEETAIRDSIEGSGGAVEQYQTWQNGKMGRAINPDYLRQLVLNAEAIRVDVVSPIYTAINEDYVASLGTVTVTYGGLL